MIEPVLPFPGSPPGTDEGSDTTEQDALVGAAREELRRRLPELRKLPGCPLGSDDAIVAMSYPPYYTACPNPFIGDWLASLERPGDEHRADPGPFVSDVSEGKGNAFYKAHSYPTKVPHPAIMRFILHYTKPGDVVLDGFAGTGMTGVAAQACGSPDPNTKAAIEAETRGRTMFSGVPTGYPRRPSTVRHLHCRRHEPPDRRQGSSTRPRSGCSTWIRNRVRLDV